MKDSKRTIFSWCPVCMIHTYHDLRGSNWHCTHEDHEHLLQKRNDPWIEKYKTERKLELSRAASTS
ncbi:MAG: hypothetical protein U5K99_03780 [Anaerolineales bacterium]|nr:hypothetical protein [Anaerolineales bacterium]